MQRIVFACLLSLSFGFVARADDYEDIVKEGYGALEITSVNGEFQGCEFNKQIPLSDGLIFVCQEYAYHYAYNPEVLILKNVQTGDMAVAIDGDLYRGTLYRGN